MNKIFDLSEDWAEIKNFGEIIPFGIGRIGRRVIKHLIGEFRIPFIIDNNSASERIYGKKILTLDEAEDYLKNHESKIVVTTMNYSYESIKLELKNRGYIEFVDFCILEKFVTEWNFRWQNKCVLSKIDTVITSRCTLRCLNCNMFISCTSSNQDLDIDELLDNFDIFFDSVDFVYEYTLLGGEPFLHKDLNRIINYLGDKYRNRIGQINFITNGTIVPSNEILELMKLYNISIHISDYTDAIDYKKIMDEVKHSFDKYNLEYYVIKNNVWKDVLYPRCEYNSQNPKQHMKICGHSTHSVGGGKLYWCDPAFAAERFIGFKSLEDDYLDLKKNKNLNSKYEATINIINYLTGNVNARGYMSICEKCAGIGNDNDKVVVAGIQVEKGIK